MSDTRTCRRVAAVCGGSWRGHGLWPSLLAPLSVVLEPADVSLASESSTTDAVEASVWLCPTIN